jgi:formylmethanofuran dehydrogenase subunit B
LKARRKRTRVSLMLSMTSERRAGRTDVVVRGKPDMGHAWIDGKPVALQAAISEAGKLLAACRAPVLAGLGTDIAGTRAVIALAQRLGGAVDHFHSGTVLRDLAVTREAGMMVTTPTEARLRADVFLLIGADLVEAWPRERLSLLSAGLPANPDTARRIIWLCPGRAGAKNIGVKQPQVIGRSPADLAVLLAALRARLAGHPVGKTRIAAKLLDGLAADLRGARFGVAVWSAAELDELAIEMLCGLVADLNTKTRFTSFSFAPADNALGVLQACGWMTGFPMRTGFGRGYPEHDPWRFDATRLVESGEADGALWISAYRAATPEWKRQMPMVALTAEGTSFRHAPRVQIEVGRPGVDHDAVEHCPATGTLIAVAASQQSGRLSVADVIAQIAATLPSTAAWPC